MSLLKDLLGQLRGSAAVDYAHFYVDPETEPNFVAPETQYVRVWLRAARITDVRRWATKFHATVHARFTFTDKGAGEREVVSVIAPDKSFEELDPEHLDRLIVVNQPLLGPVPYRGELSMEVALFSIAAADLAKPYLELLADLSKTAGVAFLGQAKPFIEPLRRGAELLFKGDGAQLEIGLARTDTKLRVGNIVVARVPKDAVSTASLRLDPNDFRLYDSNGKSVTSFPYMVIGVEATAERPDYPRIPEILGGWNAVLAVAREGRPTEDVRARFDQLRRAVWLSPDLVQTDKKRIVEIFSREISDAGYDVAPPRELASFEGATQLRPLRDASLLLDPMATRRKPGMRESAEAGVAPAGPISMAELQHMMRNPDVQDAYLKQFFTANPDTSRPFAPSIIPDPTRVEIAAPLDSREGAMLMSWANGLCRLRRQDQFNSRRARGDRRTVLVSEGDSWFQFPIFLEDIVDNLLHDFNVWSVDASGDTLQNMVLDGAEYMQALREQAGDVRAFLFSGGGNDIVGADDEGRSIISQIVKPFEAERSPEWYLETEALAAKLRFVEDCYRAVIENVAAEFPGLPVICHGYDYSIPGGGPDDPRNPMWAKKDQWLGRAMREDLRITDPRLQRAIVRLLIDRFNERIKSLCGGNNDNGAFRNAWHVDLRESIGDEWADELHPTDNGYASAAKRFAAVVRRALSHPELSAANGQTSPNAGDDAGVDEMEQASDWAISPLEAARPWRVAHTLAQLRRQVNARFPTRSTRSDGTIGDAAHAVRTSDHNPWVQLGGEGIVTAMDITHDPSSGCTGEWLAESLRASRDERVKYIIWNRRICSSVSINGVAPWQWRPYGGRNPHDHHLHLSVKPEATVFDSPEEWDLSPHLNRVETLAPRGLP